MNFLQMGQFSSSGQVLDYVITTVLAKKLGNSEFDIKIYVFVQILNNENIFEEN